MSSTNKTPNLKMHSWVRTDPVVCSDFNENFNKIDSAIGSMQRTLGNCEIYTGQYTGNGEKTHSLTFPHLPVFLLVQRDQDTGYYSGFLRAGKSYHGQENTATISFSGTTVTFTANSTSSKVINVSGTLYHYIAFAPAN